MSIFPKFRIAKIKQQLENKNQKTIDLEGNNGKDCNFDSFVQVNIL